MLLVKKMSVHRRRKRLSSKQVEIGYSLTQLKPKSPLVRWICPNHLNRCWTSFYLIGRFFHMHMEIFYVIGCLLLGSQAVCVC
jgi:hypothetical protein